MRSKLPAVDEVVKVFHKYVLYEVEVRAVNCGEDEKIGVAGHGGIHVFQVLVKNGFDFHQGGFPTEHSKKAEEPGADVGDSQFGKVGFVAGRVFLQKEE